MMFLIMLSLATANTEQKILPKCTWRRCGVLKGQLINCQEEEKGTTEDLMALVLGTKAGAVKYKCDPDVPLIPVPEKPKGKSL